MQPPTHQVCEAAKEEPLSVTKQKGGEASAPQEDPFSELGRSLLSIAERSYNSVHIFVLGEEEAVYIQVKDEIKTPVSEKDRVALNRLKEKLKEIRKRSVDTSSVIFTAAPNIPYKQVLKVVWAYEEALGHEEEPLSGKVRYIFMELGPGVKLPISKGRR